MSVSSSSLKDGSKPGFWKRGTNVPGSSKPVYGAQHPPLLQTATSFKKEERNRSSRPDSFQDFQDKTDDAWDDNDDELMLDMSNIKMSLHDVRKTAEEVISNHSRQSGAKNSNLNYEYSGQGHSHHKAAPGVGVRLNNSWQPPKPTAIRYTQETPVDREATKLEKLKTVLAGPNTNLVELQKLSWSGLPKPVRPTAWKILSGYLPASLDRRQPTMERKRQEYFSFIEQYYDSRHQEMHQETFRQIHIDIPRMNPLIPIFQQLLVQEILKDLQRMPLLAHLFEQNRIQQIFERILYIWAIRHPASGYVQGINDLVTPFFVVFLSEYIENDIEVENINLTELPEDTLNIIEADTFWCTSKLLDGIQDNYTFAQPGIQTKVNALKELIKRIDSDTFWCTSKLLDGILDNYTFAQPGIQTKVNALKELIKRIDSQLHAHLEEHSVEYLQFSFRWMNNLLMREVPLRCSIRLWDTFLSETNGFADFHLYVCAAFLTRFSKDLLRERDFQGILMFLQNLPTHHWQDSEISELLAEAFKLKYMFADAPNHLSKKS